MKPSSIMLAAALAFTVNGSAWAQTSDQPAPTPQMKQPPDPNRMVCEKIEVIGSRLTTKKVCLTRSEWAEQKRHDREDTEKIQLLRPCNGATPAATNC